MSILPLVAIPLAVLFAPPGPEATDANRPNLVVILADDFSQLDASPYGQRGLATPHIAGLAKRGMQFTGAYVASPSCAPSRASLLTALMPARHGAQVNHARPRPEIRKWPFYFQELGYEVVAFGKVSHYQHTADYGFDHFAHDGFHDHAAIPAAVEFLKTRPRTGAKPLCLLVGSNWPHVPWPEHAPNIDADKLPLPPLSIDTPATRQWRARYAAAVANLDDDVGRVVAAADKYLPEDTLLVFSSDHGSQWPFAKWNLYESGVCVPLVVCWPGVVPAGSRSEALVNWTDLLPTLVEVAGGKPPASLDGRSFVPVLRGERREHRERIFTTHSSDNRMNVYPSRAVRHDHWKYIRNLHPEAAFTTHIDLVGGALGQRAFFSTWEEAAQTDARAAALLQRYHVRPAEELYDLAADPHEEHNLASDPQHADRLLALRQELSAWMESQGDRPARPANLRLLSDPGSHGPAAAIPEKRAPPQ